VGHAALPVGSRVSAVFEQFEENRVRAKAGASRAPLANLRLAKSRHMACHDEAPAQDEKQKPWADSTMLLLGAKSTSDALVGLEFGLGQLDADPDRSEQLI
jgi:hypothetical protein